MKALIIALLSFLIVAASHSPKTAVELTDLTFEHDTQASTGGTTGDWFVNFCDISTK